MVRRQAVMFEVGGQLPMDLAPSRRPRVEIHARPDALPGPALPALGLGAGSRQLTAAELELVRLLRPGHLHVALDPHQSGCGASPMPCVQSRSRGS